MLIEFDYLKKWTLQYTTGILSVIENMCLSARRVILCSGGVTCLLKCITRSDLSNLQASYPTSYNVATVFIAACEERAG